MDEKESGTWMFLFWTCQSCYQNQTFNKQQSIDTPKECVYCQHPYPEKTVMADHAFANEEAAYLRGLRHAAEELTPSNMGAAYEQGWNARQDAIVAKVRLAVLRSGG